MPQRRKHVLRSKAGRTFFFLSLLCWSAAFSAPANAKWLRPFAAQFDNVDIFLTAIAHAGKDSPAPRKLSGITVPHHLLAADLIARGFQMVEASSIDKVIVLFPDHFKRSRLAFSTTQRPFKTVFGTVSVDQADVLALLQSKQLVDESDLFGSDHGIGALLPFIKHYMPSVRIVPIAVSVSSHQPDWDALAVLLKSIIGPTTLIVQSTDFSHYLSAHEASQHDQEVLNSLAAGSLSNIARLKQAQHTDSRGAQYLQLLLQQDVFHARPTVMFNSNSQYYTSSLAARTTSYIVQTYDPMATKQVGQDAPGSKVYCFAGDTFFGRGMLRGLSNPRTASRVLVAAHHVLNGCRLVANLTGVIVPELPIQLESLILAMPSVLTLEWLKALNTVAVSLANNHTMDLGAEPFDAMTHILANAGIVALRQGSIVDLGPFRLAALTDLDNRTARAGRLINNGDLAQLANSTVRPPLFAMINWGTDYEVAPGLRQLALMDSLHDAAVSLVIGVHPHVAAADVRLLGGGEGLSVYSLGNFMFDQDSKVASGSLLEVRVFDQGTYFARLIPHPNFFEESLTDGGPD
jgi:AmmeMemoRadiSam system protein B